MKVGLFIWLEKKKALRWAPQWSRSKCRPKETCRRTKERMLNNRGLAWARAGKKKAKTGVCGKSLIQIFIV